MVKQTLKAKNLVWIILLTCCCIAGCKNKADISNAEGLKFYNKGKYGEAMLQFQKALEINPNHYDARFHLGITYYMANRIDEAIVELQKAIDINPKDPKGHYNIAFAYVAKEKVAEALPEYQKAIDLFAAVKDQRESEAYLYKAVAYSLIERYDEAFAACKKSIELNPLKEDGYYFLGVCYYKKNMLDDALMAFKKVVSINPKSEKAHSLLFTIYDKLGRNEEATEEDRIIKQLAQERRMNGLTGNSSP